MPRPNAICVSGERDARKYPRRRDEWTCSDRFVKEDPEIKLISLLGHPSRYPRRAPERALEVSPI